jgi:outer membrane protein OmpA-like peptidoglycan-associated protein
MKNRILLLCLFLLLTACASTPKKRLSPAAQQAILLNVLSKDGVRRLEVGDELRLILPNARFFVKGTPRLKTSAYATLTRIVTLLNQRKNLGIEVLTFTPTPDLKQETSSLAKQQAVAIEGYLFDQGLNTRIIVAKAWSRKDQSDEKGDSFNRDPVQILSTEIRTRYLLAEDSE